MQFCAYYCVSLNEGVYINAAMGVCNATDECTCEHA